MKPISMVDLRSQYYKIKDEIDNQILNVIEETSFINGPQVTAFQKNLEDFLEVKHVIPCGNGTDALQIAMMALNLEPGDEVITASFTFAATVEVIALLGLKPVLVDVDPETFNIDIKSLRKSITAKTKAIVPVHLFGQCAEMDEIMQIAKENKLWVIEDAAQSIGAEYFSDDGNAYKAGTIGDIGCTSFFPSKNLGCYGDGGAIFTNDDTLAEKIRMIANHGARIRYHHEIIGVNSRLDCIQAAILNVKLPHLNSYSQARSAAATYYDKAFNNHPKVRIPVRSNKSTHVFHQYTLLLDKEVNREQLQEKLANKGIPAMVYYPIPMHLQKAYLDSRYKEGDLPVSEYLSNHVISLPMHTELDQEQLNYIKTTFLELLYA